MELVQNVPAVIIAMVVIGTINSSVTRRMRVRKINGLNTTEKEIGGDLPFPSLPPSSQSVRDCEDSPDAGPVLEVEVCDYGHDRDPQAQALAQRRVPSLARPRAP